MCEWICIWVRCILSWFWQGSVISVSQPQTGSFRKCCKLKMGCNQSAEKSVYDCWKFQELLNLSGACAWHKSMLKRGKILSNWFNIEHSENVAINAISQSMQYVVISTGMWQDYTKWLTYMCIQCVHKS